MNNISKKCPLCMTQVVCNCIPLYKYFCPINKITYSLYKCKNMECGLMFWDSRKNNFQLYEKEQIHGYDEMHSDTHHIRPAFYEFIKNIPIKNGRLLDVGCGSGLLLELANKNGYDVFGMDIDKKSIETCRNKKIGEFFDLSLEEYIIDKKTQKISLI